MNKRVFFILAALIFLSPVYAQEGGAGFKKASYWEKIKDKTVRCLLCPRQCTLDVNQRGVCAVRVNRDGTLYTLGYGNPVAVHVDPIEKKPFFHVMPGETAFSIAVAGCNMRCLFCQNWQISQSRPDEVECYNLPPEEVVNKTVQSGCKFVVYTYTEPTVFYEYMLDTARMARKKGLKNGMHSCGYINPGPLKELLQYMDAVNVDIKGFSREFYNKMGMMAELEPVLRTLKEIKSAGVWLELTNLVIPGENDDPQKVREMCLWIKENLGDSVPLHFSRFMPAYRLANLPPTPVEKLQECRRIAMECGLKYVYIGNVPGHYAESTYCPQCDKLLVGRSGYRITENNIMDGKCKFCGHQVPGIWRE
ncbi:MAG: AmmeMemoRadiSam system radical SAM enzyme [Elusimicrobia bacterium]|nr:AmmeMemoRadiSam system radical SAM enzyme [Elusimicrobiota bacterium]